jgi:hypothetical protein
MPQILKPTNLSLTWASGGDILNPGDTKYASGWAVEIPARQWFNYLDNRQDTALAHINQHGIAVWDSATEYQYSVGGAKSLVMGSNGTIYRALTVNTNQDPTTTVGTHWEIAFANAGDFYTKVQSDANYLAKTQNLADLTNTATARTNLSVYSQAETYTKTEVDAKTTIASTGQAQAWISNTTLLTPLRLDEAFKGANQSLTSNGFQKLPGGIIEQWGITTFASISAGQQLSITGTFPVAFPNAALIPSVSVVTSDPNNFSVSFLRTSNTQFTVYLGCSSGSYSNVPVEWRVLGR